jgi:hypothetical protein
MEYPEILCIGTNIDPIEYIDDNNFSVVIYSISAFGDDVKLYICFSKSYHNLVGMICKKNCACCFQINLEFDEFNSATICETVRANFKDIFNHDFLPEVYNNIEKAIYNSNDIPKRALMQ